MHLITKLIFLSTFAFAQTAPVMKTIELEWDEVPNADSYIVRLTPMQPAGEPWYFTTKTAELSEKVPVGTYELRIRPKSKEADVFSKWSDPSLLEVAVKAAKPLHPEDKSTIEAK